MSASSLHSDASLGGQTPPLGHLETPCRRGSSRTLGSSSRLLAPQSQSQSHAPPLTAPSQLLDKGEESPLLSHCLIARSQTSPLPDILEALQGEQANIAAAQQQLQSQEMVPENDLYYYDSEEEYHSPLEEDEVGNENAVSSSLYRLPADQVDHPLRSLSALNSSSNSNSKELLYNGGAATASALPLGLHHPLRNTLASPSPPALIQTLDEGGSTIGSTTSRGGSRRRQRQQTCQQQQHQQQQQQQLLIVEPQHLSQRSFHSGAPSISSSTTNNTSITTASASSSLRGNRATSNNSNSNSRLAQQQQREREQYEGSTTGLRASLDAGMAAMSRWIRTRTTATTTTPAAVVASRARSASARTISWHGGSAGEGMMLDPGVGSTTSVGAGSNSLGDEDLFALTMNGDDPRSPNQQSYATILEEQDEDDEEVGRQRALSEPDALRIRRFFQRAVGGGATASNNNTSSLSSRSVRRRRGRRAWTESEGATILDNRNLSPGRAPHLSSSAAAALYAPGSASNRMLQQPDQAVDLMSSRSIGSVPVVSSSLRDGGIGGSGGTERILAGDSSMREATNRTDQAAAAARLDTSVEMPPTDPELDPERQARIRWVRINRRFQLVITIVALLFSLLLFAILICWVVLTSAYVISFEKSCDIPLKPYFWLVTLQLVLDVFRSDIMRFVFHWDPGSNERIPFRVIAYNIAYLLYALMVLRLGLRSLLDEDATCRNTAPELYNSSAAFVSLSIAAWTTILCGYLLPFCVVAALLTYNGYNPSAHTLQDNNGPTQPVFPAAYSTTGAPPGCVDQLPLLRMEDFPDDYPPECCICMEEFDQAAVVVETSCKHVFHKQCCREWLRTARSCPMCRADIPSTLEELPEDGEGNGPRIPLGPTGRPVVGLLRILRSGEGSTANTAQHPATAQRGGRASPSSVTVNQNVP